MERSRLRRWAATVLLVAGTTGLGIVAPATTASATTATGGCSAKPHHAHTTDAAPYAGWACWIDNGDIIRVCDNANNGVHVHADIWFDAGGFWLKIEGEDDGEDAGCDDQPIGDLKGYNRMRLRVCEQRADQSNFHCGETIWFEQE